MWRYLVIFVFGVVSLGLIILFLEPNRFEFLPAQISDVEQYVSPFRNKPPFPVKAIYLTPYSAASSKRLPDLMNWINNTELNAVVVDIKDSTGKVFYPSQVRMAQESGALESILKLNPLVRKLHENGIYAIARMVVFQDPILAQAHPEWAVQQKNGKVWKDNRGLSWLDPASKDVWEYNFVLAEEAIFAGFDEINFDYIRFPSDGDLDNAVFPIWQEQTSKVEIISSFFEALYQRLHPSGVKLSADLFGLTFYDKGDLNIGQRLEEAAGYFDYLAPMVYPSHFGGGVFGFTNPAEHPYEVIKITLTRGQERLVSLSAQILDTIGTPSVLALKLRAIHPDGKLAQVRPWLQDFDLETVYTKKMILSEIQAAQEADSFGFMIWDPANEYTRNIFEEDNFQ